MRRPFLTVSALALALSGAACTPDDAVSGLSLACEGLQAGTQLTVQVAPLFPNGEVAVPIASTVGVAGQIACPVLVASTQAIVDRLNAAGQTARITATTTDPVTRQTKTRRMTVAPGGHTVFSGDVAPSGFRF